ncbi:hypothetical protein VB712_00420 [Spirulina sp. CCNP1310]|nr:hypothetical protein [Spirulina sp. CCNP1310]
MKIYFSLQKINWAIQMIWQLNKGLAGAFHPFLGGDRLPLGKAKLMNTTLPQSRERSFSLHHWTIAAFPLHIHDDLHRFNSRSGKISTAMIIGKPLKKTSKNYIE